MANEQARAAPTTTTTSTQTPTGGGGSGSSQSSSGRGVQLKQSLRGLDFASQEAAPAPVQAKGPADGADIQREAAAGVSGGGGKLPHLCSQILLPDVKADVSAVDTLIDGITDIEAREKAEEQAALAKSAGAGAAAYGSPEGSEVKGQGDTRAYRYKEDKRTTKKASRKVPTTDKTVGDVGVALDPNERRMATGTASWPQRWPGRRRAAGGRAGCSSSGTRRCGLRASSRTSPTVTSPRRSRRGSRRT